MAFQIIQILIICLYQSSYFTELCKDMLADYNKFGENAGHAIISYLKHYPKPICLIANNGTGFDFIIIKENRTKKMPMHTSSSNIFQGTTTNSLKCEESSSEIKSLITATNLTTIKSEKRENISYKEYKAAGEYWNKYPKTDYTYSHMSPHRREVVPGIVAMPNMSRKSLQVSTSSSLGNDTYDYMNREKYNRSVISASNNQRKHTELWKIYSEIQIDQYSHTQWISYHNVIKKFLNFFSWMHVLFPTKYTQSSYESGMGQLNFESIKADLLIQLLLRSSFLNGLRALYMLISFCLYIDASLLRSIKFNRHVKFRFGFLVFILLPCLTSIVGRSTENDNFSSSRPQGLITMFFDNVRKNVFLTRTNILPPHNVNCFWAQLQSSKLYCGGKLGKEIINSLMVDENNKTLKKYLRRVIKVNKKFNGEIYTKSYPHVKMHITDLSQIIILLITTKNIDLIERKYFDKTRNSSNPNLFLVQNTLSLSNEGYMTNEVNKFSEQDNSLTCVELLKLNANADKDGSCLNQDKMANVIKGENEEDSISKRRKPSQKYEKSLLDGTPLLFTLLRRNLISKFKMDILKLEPLLKESSYLITEENIKAIVNEAIEIYDADKTGKFDYALETAGGQVLSTRCTETYSTKTSQISVFGISIWASTNSPRSAIKPSVFPGECWAFQGFPGSLVVKLNALIYVTGFTIEHVRKNLTPYGCIDSAPKNFTVWGLLNEDDQNPHLFGEYQFLDNGVAIQYFPVKSKSTRQYDITELKIESNHGNELYTCLYRFRVHGTPFYSND